MDFQNAAVQNKNSTIGKDITPISKPLTTSYLKTEFSIEPTNETIFDRFKRCVKSSPDKEALVIADVDPAKRQAVTFKDCDDLSDNLAARLIKEGVGIKDAVAVLIPNCTEFIVSWMALLKCHVYPAFVSFNMTNGDDLKYVLNELKAVGIILHTGVADEYYGIIKSVFGKFLNSKHDPDIPNLKFLIALGSRPFDGAIPYDDMIRRTTELGREALQKRVATVTADSPCVILQTSGSSGRPKLVVHRHFSSNGFLFVAARYHLSKNDRYFCDRPLTWAGGFTGIIVACIVGTTAVTIDTTISVAKRDVNSILKIISREKCTKGLMMPYMLYDMLELPSVEKYNLEAFTKFLTAGQRIPRVLVEKIFKNLPKASMVVAYGSTEMWWVSSQFHDATPDIVEDQMETIGYPFPGFEVKITDENDQVVPIGTPGNIKTKSQQMFIGYFNDEKKTNEKIKDGWFNMEDFGYITEKGYLVFTSKKCDMIKRGTVLIAPGSIENVILDHPVVSKVIVVGVPDPRLYEELCACVVLHPGESRTERDIIDYCNERFTEQTLDGLSLTPKFVIIMDDFPKLPNGKPDKISLKMMAAEKCGI
ncbi:unnamed protein product [Owenia fusiformis]|uniref:Uncharacterized protein n=1 Tax=Owenia fusiformis TaxID=6347 RepID=A0A8J1U7W7_OWEFU|nr:unnamed protein product [Owenia fusiformis]